MVALIRWYQRTISEVTPHRCRFQPTCSEYVVEAVQRHGVRCGLWLGIKRIARCHPFSESRYDPVPQIATTRRVESRN
ncbi:MAG TPA: membrane protein insertion efficiency factor YidD [Propionibacteriaceae bacterium]|nr:membrane protein insertion efficiency factor YidD [Propionibacteriaceae bacterium]